MMRVRPVRDLVRSQGGVCYAFFFNQYSIVRFFLFFSFPGLLFVLYHINYFYYNSCHIEQ